MVFSVFVVDISLKLTASGLLSAYSIHHLRPSLLSKWRQSIVFCPKLSVAILDRRFYNFLNVKRHTEAK